MMALDDYRRFDARGLAQLVQRREVAPGELVEAAHRAIELLNPRLNAVILTLAEQALDAAHGPVGAGPFAGVPFLLKDSMVSLAGVPTEFGSRYFKGYTRAFDSELVRRYKQAGFIMLGKTNMAELGTSGSTDNIATGPMHNPWNTERIPGSSSGGSAAAVASGMVPAAHATDAGGSLRGPASWCGLVGLKPTRGRISSGPDAGENWFGLAAQHVVTRSVGDSAAILDCTAGPAVGDPYFAPTPERPFLMETTTDPGRLHIGFSDRSAKGGPVDGEMLTALHATARLLQDLGHHVEEATPAWDAGLLGEAIMAICATVVAEAVAERQAATGRPPSEAMLEKSNLWLVEQGARLTATDILRASRKVNTATRSFAQFFENWDVWLTPTMGGLPPQLGYLDSGTDNISLLYERLWSFFRFNSVYNATGLPAITLPLHMSSDGLPIGMMFGAGFGKEGLLYRLAGQLERAVPWIDRHPAVSLWADQ